MIESLNQLEEQYPKGSKELKKYNPETVWEQYNAKIKPNLGVIARFLSFDKPATVEVLTSAIGVTKQMWYACASIFEDFKEVLQVKEDYMKVKSEIDLQLALVQESKPNAKLLEMQLKMYNEDYNDKGKDISLKLPDTLRVEVLDAELTEEDLEEFTPKID